MNHAIIARLIREASLPSDSLDRTDCQMSRASTPEMAAMSYKSLQFLIANLLFCISHDISNWHRLEWGTCRQTLLSHPHSESLVLLFFFGDILNFCQIHENIFLRVKLPDLSTPGDLTRVTSRLTL